MISPGDVSPPDTAATPMRQVKPWGQSQEEDTVCSVSFYVLFYYLTGVKLGFILHPSLRN